MDPLDCSFINPTIIALGKIDESHADELRKRLESSPVLIWNLSGKSLPVTFRQVFQNQIIDVEWRTPGEYTQAPSLTLLFNLCYSIKSWLDLNSDNVAVVHCANGRSKSGMLIACYLKYVDAFKSSSEAFKHFCFTRCGAEVNTTPTYRQLFKSIDDAVDRGFQRRGALVLQQISISGLRDCDATYIELWCDGEMVLEKRLFLTQFGDGLFKIGTKVLGDFMILCRIGGDKSQLRDKTALVFKYQNHTGNTPLQTELHVNDIDLNPMRKDSIDTSTFVVHLFFEELSSEDGSGGMLSSIFPIGANSFIEGLKMLERHHILLEDAQRETELLQLKISPKFLKVSLKLANNDRDKAIEVLQKISKTGKEYVQKQQQAQQQAQQLQQMRSQQRPLEGAQPQVAQQQLQAPPSLTTSMPLSTPVPAPVSAPINSSIAVNNPQSLVAKANNVSTVITSTSDGQANTLVSTSTRVSGINNAANSNGSLIGGGINNNNVIVDKGNTNNDSISGDVDSNTSIACGNNDINSNGCGDNPAICAVCFIHSEATIHQIIRCQECKRGFHAECVGLRKIPFDFSTEKGRINVIKYVSKHYGNWLCKDCLGSMPTASGPSVSTIASGVIVTSKAIQLATAAGGSSVAALSGISSPLSSSTTYNQSSSSISLESLQLSRPSQNLAIGDVVSPSVAMAAEVLGSLSLMGQSEVRSLAQELEDNNKEDNIDVTNYDDNDNEGDSDDDDNNNRDENDEDDDNNDSEGHDVDLLLQTISQPPLHSGEEDEAPRGDSPESIEDDDTMSVDTEEYHDAQGSWITGESPTVSLSPKYRSQVLPASSIGSRNIANDIVNAQSSSRSPTLSSKLSNGIIGGNSLTQSTSNQTNTSNVDKGVSIGDVESLSTARTTISEQNSMSHNSNDSQNMSNASSMLSKLFQKDQNNEEQEETKIASAQQPSPEPPKKNKAQMLNDLMARRSSFGSSEMTSERTDSQATVNSIIQRQPQTLGADNELSVTTRGNDSASSSSGVTNQTRENTSLENNISSITNSNNQSEPALRDHSKYGKFIKMVTVGLPLDSVAKQMVEEKCVDNQSEATKILQMDPNKPMMLVSTTTAPVKMMDDLQNKLASGASLASIAADITSSVPASSGVVLPVSGGRSTDMSGATNSSAKTVAAKDHPVYNKYFKMLKVGLPKDAVKAKMQQEGADPSVLDKNPEEQVPLAETLPANGIDSNNSSGGKVAVKDHPKYSKYFKMIKVGLPKEAVKGKMQQEGADPSMLDKDPEELVSLEEKKSEETVAIKDHPKYGKYLKMLKVGLPKDAVKAKMQQEGADPSVLDKDPEEQVPLEEKKSSNNETIAAKDHPKYGKYFKMLKVGLPKDAVKTKMQQEGADPSVLDKDPEEQIPVEEKKTEETVAAKDHPKYSKYFRMLKVGLPKESVKAKMQQEGVDPNVLDKDPDQMIPLHESSSAPSATSTGNPFRDNANKAAKNVVRKKRLHWKAIEAGKLSKESLWNEESGEGDIELDEAEFNQLFVESGSTANTKDKVGKSTESTKKKVCLVDMKRGQNAGIALARIKMSFEDIKHRIRDLESSHFSIEQLQSLKEFLPTEEEKRILRTYNGAFDNLGQAEKYMKTMMDLPVADKRIDCMVFRLQFQPRVKDCFSLIEKVEKACDDVRMSGKLKKVLKTILKVGNQMNDTDQKHVGFTLDSLLKLQSAKAFDNRTTILQYVISLIYRNDRESLDFPAEIQSIGDASRVTMEAVTTELNTLRRDHKTNMTSLEGPISGGRIKFESEVMSPSQDGENVLSPSKSNQNGLDQMCTFVRKAQKILDELDKVINRVKQKYYKVLSYFGEEDNMESHVFFSTLSRFTSEFTTTKDIVERLRKQEEKKRLLMEKQQKSAEASGMVGGNQTSSQEPLASLSVPSVDFKSSVPELGSPGTKAALKNALNAKRRASMY